MSTNETLILTLVLTSTFSTASMLAIGMFVDSDGRRLLLLGLDLIITLAIIIPTCLAINA